MGTGIYWLVGASAVAAFGVCLRFALQMLIDRRHRDSAGWFFWSFLPLLAVCLVLAARGDPIMSEMTRNIFLGFVGAIMGASGAVWGGYAVSGMVEAKAQGSPGLGNNNNQPTVNITGDGHVTSFNQSGGITANTVNIGQQPRTITDSQKELICSSLNKSDGSSIRIDLIVITKPEIQQYAEQIYNVLFSCGFNINVMNFGSLIPEPLGIVLYDPGNELSRLRTAFDTAGIRYTRSSNRASDSPYPPATPAVTIGVGS